jgi:protein MAK16
VRSTEVLVLWLIIIEKRAERAANLEIAIEKELLNRLKEGVYPKEIYNVSQKDFEKALEEHEIEEEKEYEVDSIEDYDEESEEELEREYVDADMDEVGDLEDMDEEYEQSGDEGDEQKRMVEIEYEVDDEQEVN